MPKIVKHPAVTQNFENKIANISKGKEAPFENIERTKNKAFNKFMDKADALFYDSNAREELIKETFLFNKALRENPEYINLSKEISKMRPKTSSQIEEYREKTNKLLEFTKKSGAKTLHENMKLAFDSMIELVQNNHGKNLDTNI